MNHARILLLGLCYLLPALAVAADAPDEVTTTDDTESSDPVEADDAPWVDDGRPWLWYRGSLAVAYGPLGLLHTSRLQVRGALGRSKSVLFQTTYAGAGLGFAVSPAFIEVGPRLSLAPIEIFDVDLQGSYTFTWKGSSGLLPYSSVGGTLEKDRELLGPSSKPGGKFTLMVSPTIKLKVGPVIGLWNVEWAFIHHMDQTSSPLVYEALRDLVIARTDMIVTNIAAILVEAFDGTGPNGGPGPTLRVGAIMRDKQSYESRDISTALGGAVMFRPGPKRGWPDVLLVVMGYLRDDVRAFSAPNIQLQLAWVLDKKFGKARIIDDIKGATR